MTQVLSIDNFAGGVHNREVPENIAPNEFADASNFLLTHGGLPEPRLGYAALADTLTNVVTLGVYQKNDGTEIVVARCSDDHLHALVTSPTWTDIGTLSTGGSRTCFINWNNYLYIMDGYNFKKWDGTTLSDVAHGLGVDFFPRYGCGHGTRLFVGNYSYDGTNYPGRAAFCAAWDDTNWETDAVMNELYYDYEVTGLESSGNLLMGTRQAIYMVWDDVNIGGTAYFPSQRLLSPVGVLPWTMVKSNKDVYFANATGVYSISATQNFGDLEAARVSFKIDKTFDDYFSTTNQDNCCALYYESRDEYWLSIPTSTGYKTIVGKVSLAGQAGRLPWMPQSLEFGAWCYKPGSDQLLFANSTNVYLYTGRSDNTGAITFTYTTAKFGSNSYERKRLSILDAQFMRWSDLTNGTSVQVTVYADDVQQSSLTFSLVSVANAGPTWDNFQWGAANWASVVLVKQEEFLRQRIAKYARSWYLIFTFSSATMGAVMTRIKLAFEETGR